MPGKAHKTQGTPDHAHEQQALEPSVFFSDAVFAIAITILALDIRLPFTGSDLNDGQLAAALLSIWPKYIGYMLSFLVIGSYWDQPPPQISLYPAL